MASVLFSKEIVSERIKKMNEYVVFDWELTDDEFVSDNQKPIKNENILDISTIKEDSTTALLVLGYSKRDAKKYVDKATSSGLCTVEDIVKYSLSLTKKK